VSNDNVLGTNKKLELWRSRLIDLLKDAAADDVFLSMSTVAEGQPITYPFDRAAVQAMSEDGQCSYESISLLDQEPVVIDEERAVVANVFVVATEMQKFENKERVPLDREELHAKPSINVMVYSTGTGTGVAYVTHQIAEFLSYRGWDEVYLHATHTIDAVRTMMKSGSGPYTHPRKGDDSATWDIPITVAMDEGAKNENRDLHEVVVREAVPEWLNDIMPGSHADAVQQVNGRFQTDGHFGKEAVIFNMNPGEPFFIVLGRDPQAPYLVEQWATDRQQIEPEDPKILNALNIASMMRQYKDDNPTIGMPKLKFEQYLEKELIIIPNREKPYTEEEILIMVQEVLHRAVLSGVNVHIQHNTAIIHLAVENAVEQQLANVSKLSAAAGKDVLIIIYEEDMPVKAWGSHDLLYSHFGKDVADKITYYRPGEYEDMRAADELIVPDAPATH
jgi:hypothetical protein